MEIHSNLSSRRFVKVIGRLLDMQPPQTFPRCERRLGFVDGACRGLKIDFLFKQEIRGSENVSVCFYTYKNFSEVITYFGAQK